SEYIFNSMTALTHEEVKYLLKEIPNKDNHYHTIIKNYEGYLFHGKAEEKVFNPTLIMYYLNYAKHGLERLNLMDPNIISSYHQIQYIASLGNDKEILHDILYHGEVVSSLTLKIPLTAKYYKRDVVSLLYYLGYLSIQDFKDSKYHFVIPNQCMKRFYAEYYLSILKSDLKKSYDKEEIDLVHEVYEDGKLNKLCEYISQLLKDIDNQTFSNYTEKDLQIILYIILFRYSAFDVYLEYSINNNFIDLAIFTKKYNYLVEIKYIKEKDKKSYDEVYQKAKEQIKKYTIHKDNLRKYIIIFTGSHYMLEEIM
ncbi:MAG: PD-(D/E)XK nuclease domain-containing protein, partial [Bacilli bacterium]|nr:PD-(D/E)XK nuclease domain-containing protein [Bacilli bacterium]